MESLAGRVKEHEAYNSQLQEVEKWLLQMSSRLVNSDSMHCSSLEEATQQLARHKVTSEGKGRLLLCSFDLCSQ